MLDSQPLLFKIAAYFNSWFDAIFGPHWMIYLILFVFSYVCTTNCMVIFGDNGLSEKCHTIQKALAQAQKESMEHNSKNNESSTVLHQIRSNVENTKQQISSVQGAIGALKNWEVE